MNASPASPACAATGTPPRDTGVRGTDRHVLHLRAGPVAPAVGRLVVGEGAGGQSSKQGHRTPRPVVPSTSRLLAGDAESGKRAGPLQGLDLLVAALGRIKAPKPCRWPGRSVFKLSDSGRLPPWSGALPGPPQTENKNSPFSDRYIAVTCVTTC